MTNSFSTYTKFPGNVNFLENFTFALKRISQRFPIKIRTISFRWWTYSISSYVLCLLSAIGIL